MHIFTFFCATIYIKQETKVNIFFLNNLDIIKSKKLFYAQTFSDLVNAQNF